MPGWPEIFILISKSANETQETQISGIQLKWVVYLVGQVQLGIGIEHRRLTLLDKYLHVQRDGEKNPKRKKKPIQLWEMQNHHTHWNPNPYIKINPVAFTAYLTKNLLLHRCQSWSIVRSRSNCGAIQGQNRLSSIEVFLVCQQLDMATWLVTQQSLQCQHKKRKKKGTKVSVYLSVIFFFISLYQETFICIYVCVCVLYQTCLILRLHSETLVAMPIGNTIVRRFRMAINNR